MKNKKNQSFHFGLIINMVRVPPEPVRHATHAPHGGVGENLPINHKFTYLDLEHRVLK